MRYLIIIPLLTFIILPISSMAKEDEKENNFDIKDYNILIKTLNAKGIDHFSLNWNEIEKSCEIFKGENEKEYNNCRLEKAGLQDRFLNDKNTCSVKSLNAYPNSLLTETEEHKIIEHDGNKTLETKIIKGAISEDDLSERRRGYFVNCMSNFGWINTSNWLQGIRERCN